MDGLTADQWQDLWWEEFDRVRRVNKLAPEAAARTAWSVMLDTYGDPPLEVQQRPPARPYASGGVIERDGLPPATGRVLDRCRPIRGFRADLIIVDEVEARAELAVLNETNLSLGHPVDPDLVLGAVEEREAAPSEGPLPEADPAGYPEDAVPLEPAPPSRRGWLRRAIDRAFR